VVIARASNLRPLQELLALFRGPRYSS